MFDVGGDRVWKQLRRVLRDMTDYQKNSRIEWIDIFKGILIILVVLGHATGNFNWWIYQFHMGAFFFISGYLSNIEKKNSLSLMVKKLLTIFLPFSTISIVGILIVWLTDEFGKHQILFGYSFLGLGKTFSELFLHGRCYVQWLGTFWFLITLLGIELMQIVLYQLNNKKINCLYFVMCLVFFLLGYWMVRNSIGQSFWIFSLDLIFIGQGYFNIGLFLRKKNIKKCLCDDRGIATIFLLLVAVGISAWGKMNAITVDYPSRNFKYPFSEPIIALADIYIVFFVAHYILKYSKYLRRIMELLGKNSLGIMAMHFLFFKLYMVVLCATGCMSLNEITDVVLPVDYQMIWYYWMPMVLIAIVGSLGMWKLMSSIPGVRFLMGQDWEENKIIVNKIESNRILIKIGNKCTNTISNLWKGVEEYSRSHKKLCLVLSSLVVLFAIPMYRTGIIINDELQARCLSMQGFSTFYKIEFAAWIKQGRLLAAPINSFTKWLSFIGADLGTSFRLGSIVILVGVVITFGLFIYKAIGDKWLGLFSAVFTLATMPIAFEHTSPNAFVGFVALPFMLVLISNSVYVKYIETKTKKYAVLSMSLFFIAMMSYEAFVTFVVLYLFVVMGKTGFNNIKKNIRLYIIPLVTTVLFLICYMLSSKFATSDYAGNQFGIESILEPIRIIANLFIACIPGFLIVNPKYQYYRSIYHDLDILDYLRIILFVSAFAIVGIVALKNALVKQQDNNKQDLRKHVYIIFCGICYMILPSVPNSLASMYQGIVGSNGSFLTLPVTFMEFFAAAFVICYIVFLIVKKIGGKFFVIVIALLCLLVANIQEMNDCFSKEQNSNFERITEIEDFLSTDTVKNLPAGRYYSADLYKQQNLLVIHSGYWSEYCTNVLGIGLQLTEENVGTEIGNIYYDGDNFVITNFEYITVVSRDQEMGHKAIQIDDEKCIIYDFESADIVCAIDNGMYVYMMPNDERIIQNAGYNAISGSYSDGWLTSTSEFNILTGDEGSVTCQFFYPGNSLEDKKIDIYMDDVLIDVIYLNDELTDFQFNIEPSTSHILKFKCNFTYEEKDESDIRPLSVFLLKMEVK